MRFFPYLKDEEFNGILHNSQDEFNVTHSKENFNDDRIKYLYDNNPHTHSCLAQNEYNYYHFKFLHYNVKITSYSIQSYRFSI